MAAKKKMRASEIKTFSIANLQHLFGIEESPRNWPISLSWGVAVTAVILVFAVVANEWLGRTIHWDWVAIFGSMAFIGLSLGRKARIL